jgi:hypothetical protein
MSALAALDGTSHRLELDHLVFGSRLELAPGLQLERVENSLRDSGTPGTIDGDPHITKSPM